jgi:hypothetical protein
MRSGSLMATLGVTRQSTMAIFTCVPVLVMMQKRVTSLASSGGRVDGKEWRHRAGRFICSLLIANVAADGHNQADSIAAIMRTSAAKRHNAIAFVLNVCGNTVVNVFCQRDSVPRRQRW